MAKKKDPIKLYQVGFFNPEDRHPIVTVFAKRAAALLYIKKQFYDLQDTGDRLCTIGPTVYVLEEDYKNTGVRATVDNYKNFYYWQIEEFG